MKKILLCFLLLSCFGCVTVKMPKYLKDEFPYQKKFYASYDDTLTATMDALKGLGWEISETSHPSVFEHGQLSEAEGARQILIFTEIRQTPLFLSSRYMSLNVYVRMAGNESTDVEIRYVSVTPMLFKNSQSYKNEGVVQNVFDRISELLNQ